MAKWMKGEARMIMVFFRWANPDLKMANPNGNKSERNPKISQLSVGVQPERINSALINTLAQAVDSGSSILAINRFGYIESTSSIRCRDP